MASASAAFDIFYGHYGLRGGVPPVEYAVTDKLRVVRLAGGNLHDFADCFRRYLIMVLYGFSDEFVSSFRFEE